MSDTTFECSKYFMNMHWINVTLLLVLLPLARRLHSNPLRKLLAQSISKFFKPRFADLYFCLVGSGVFCWPLLRLVFWFVAL